MIHTPWEGAKDQKILYGKNNIGVIYNFNFGFSADGILEIKDDKNTKDVFAKEQE